MAGQNEGFGASKTIAGAALAGLGLFILYGNLAREAVRITHVLSANGFAALGLFPAAILSVHGLLHIYSADHQGFLWGALRHLLLTSWPLVLVTLGTALSRDAFVDELQPSPKKLCTCRSDCRLFDVTAEVDVKCKRRP